MNRAAALLALLALAACGGGAGDAPKTVTKGVDIDAELAALRSDAPSQRDVNFWTAEGARLSTLWARALPVCSRGAVAFYRENGPAAPNCVAVLRAAQRVFGSQEASWQQRYNYLGSAFFSDENLPPTPNEDELLPALNSNDIHPVFSNIAFWYAQAYEGGELWPVAFQHCAKSGAPGINPSCVAVLRAAANFYDNFDYKHFFAGERRKSPSR